MITVRIASPLLKGDSDPTVLDRLQPWINAMVPLANAIRARVKEHGTVVGEQPKYSTSKGYATNPQYSELAGAGPRTWSGSSQQFHTAAGAKAGTGNTTGGMWSGYQVRTYGQDAVVIDFAGSTLGRTTEVGKRGNPLKVLNSTKAGSIWQVWQVNVTQPADDEQEALHAAVVQQARVVIARAFGLEAPGPVPVANAALYAAISRAWVTK